MILLINIYHPLFSSLCRLSTFHHFFFFKLNIPSLLPPNSGQRLNYNEVMPMKHYETRVSMKEGNLHFGKDQRVCDFILIVTNANKLCGEMLDLPPPPSTPISHPVGAPQEEVHLSIVHKFCDLWLLVVLDFWFLTCFGFLMFFSCVYRMKDV